MPKALADLSYEELVARIDATGAKTIAALPAALRDELRRREDGVGDETDRFTWGEGDLIHITAAEAEGKKSWSPTARAIAAAARKVK